MNVEVMRSKLHRATVTGADLNYEGSISICPKLQAAADFHKYEKVEIYNINNGARISTYVIDGNEDEICMNGAAARHAHYGDKVIIVSYGTIDRSELPEHTPIVVLLGEENVIKEITSAG
ncbi:MAG: aspartate 1-decarboxylase [Bacteriovoracaceae bacterium]|nr:aspartate 1-decarboxylase [Bacteriovoracaceae bacterium]